MGTTPTLLDVVAREGEAETQRILDAAMREAARVLTDAETDVKAAVRARVEERCRALATESGRRLATARQSARRQTLEARERLLDRVKVMATAMLPDAVTGPEGASRAAVLLDEAWQYLPPEQDAVVRCSPALADVVRTSLPRDRAVDIVLDPAIRAGVRVESSDGRLTIDNTLETRLRRMWDALAAELVAPVSAELPQP